MMESSTKVRPIDSFTLIYRVLTLAGHSKHLVKPKSYWKYKCHQMYRPVGFLIVFTLNLIQIIYIYQVRSDTETVLEALMMHIPHLQLLVKCIAWNYYSSKFERIHDALANDPKLMPSTEKDVEFLMEDKRRIMNLTKRALKLVGVSGVLWALSYILKKLRDPRAQIQAYIPFNTDTWLSYSVAVIIYTCFTQPWNLYGNISFDCAIAAYYSQAQTQLKMIRHHLERLAQHVDDSSGVEVATEVSLLHYRDEVDPNIRERFVYIVEKYDKVVWYTERVGEVLEKSVGCGFLLNCFGVCLSVFMITSTDNIYLLGHLTSYSIALLAQVFLHCYFGGLVTVESDLLNTSIYMSEWYTLSPGFRRGILIAMERWLRPIVPRVHSFVVVPLSLGTFITIVKSTYSLYTVLNAAKSE